MASFYDLNYLIEINEKRLQEHIAAYRLQEGKFTNLLVIYSAFCIFLVPVIQSLCWHVADCSWLMYSSFGLFILLLCSSLYYAVKLLLPGRTPYLDDPIVFYQQLLRAYNNGSRSMDEINQLIKASYISQLEPEVAWSGYLAAAKYTYYFRAIALGLMAAIPYLVCAGFQLSLNAKNTTMNTLKICTLGEITVMSEHNKKTATPLPADERFQGIKTNDVIVLNIPYIIGTLIGPPVCQEKKKWAKERAAIFAPYR